MTGKINISKKKMRIIIVMSSIALVVAIAIEYREQGLYAILAGITASGLWLIRDNVFVKSLTLRSQLFYHATTIVVVTLGFLIYALLASFPPMSSWGLKLVLSILASISVTLSCLFLARLMKVNTVPWRENDNKNF